MGLGDEVNVYLESGNFASKVAQLFRLWVRRVSRRTVHRCSTHTQSNWDEGPQETPTVQLGMHDYMPR